MESPRVQRGYLHKLIRQCAAPVVGLVCLSVKDKAVLGRSLDSVMGRMVRNNKGSRLHRNLEMEAQGSSKRIKEKKLQDMCGWCLRSLPSDQALLCSRCQVVYYCDIYLSNYSVIYPLLSFILYYPSQYCTNARVYKKFLTLTILPDRDDLSEYISNFYL